MIAFHTPWLLAALVLLPLIWRWLRVVHAPQRILAFPALRFITPHPKPPRNTSVPPLWLRILRIIIIALTILAFASPYIPAPDNDSPHPNTLSAESPLLLVIDNGWASAAHWHTHMQTLRATLESLPEHRFIILTTALPPDDTADSRDLSILSARQAQDVVDTLSPQPWQPLNAQIAQFLKEMTAPSASPRLKNLGGILWLHDGIDSPDKNTLLDSLHDYADQRDTPLYSLTSPSLSLPVILASPPADAEVHTPSLARVLAARAAPSREHPPYHLQGFDADNRLLFNKPFHLRGQETLLDASAEQAPFLHQLHSLRLISPHLEPHAGGVLLHDGGRRLPTIFVLEPSSDSPPPLLNPSHYIAQALNRSTHNSSLQDALDQRADIIFWHDHARIDSDEQEHLLDWLAQGGILVRFASPHVQDSDNHPHLLPAPLYEITASAHGFLSDTRDETSTLHFADNSPFHHLKPTSTHVNPTYAFIDPPQDVHIWAYTDDHRPLISARSIASGWLVFFHAPLHPLRSDLALEALFPTILTTLTRLRPYQRTSSNQTPTTLWQPQQILDGWGQLSSPEPTTQALGVDARPSPHTPPGIYATAYERRALNLGDALGVPTRFIDAPPPLQSPTPPRPQRLIQGWLLTLIILLLAVHALYLTRRNVYPAVAAGVFVFCALLPVLVSAQPPAENAPFYAPRIGYMLSHDDIQDNLSDSGLTQLTQFINRRTVARLGQPLPLTPQSPLLPFVPLIYWPLGATNTHLSPTEARIIEHYLSKGGIILFDSIDGSARLQSSLSLPPLVPIDDEHTVTRSFFLIPLSLWRKTNTPLPWSDHHAQANTLTASVFASQHNWAQLWRSHLYVPQQASVLTRQELAMRFGLNLVLYALTGNYKRDQIHALTIIERLKNKP